jgi:DNA-binding winged helix-turn-helix (wHTH) protein
LTIVFGPCRLDGDARVLTREGQAVHLTPKAFDLLLALAADRPKVRSKAELQALLWPDTFVAEANLSNLVAEVRAALGDSVRHPRYVRTVHGRGYAFCAEAITAPAVVDHRPPCWLAWGRLLYPLTTGAHVIGRDGVADVTLEHPSVSRRHARVVVTPDAATIEDTSSKNGTFVGAACVTGPVALADGDVIRLGALVTFHARRPGTATATHVSHPA